MSLRPIFQFVLTVLVITTLTITSGCGSKPLPAQDTPRPQSTTSSQPPQSKKVEDYSDSVWAAIVQQGQKIGFSLEQTREVKVNNLDLIETVTEEQFEIKRLNQSITIKVTNRFLEYADGGLHSYETQMNQGAIATKFIGKVTGERNKLTITTQTLGQNITNTVPWKSEWGGLHAVKKLLEEEPIQPGQKRTALVMVPLLNQACRVEFDAKSFEEVTMLDGSKVQLLKVINQVTAAGSPPLETIFWVNHKGETIKTKSVAQNLEIFKCSKQYAKSPNSAIKFDLAADTMVPVSGDMTGIHNKQSAIYEVKLKHSNPSEIFPARSNQFYESLDSHTIKLHVLRSSLESNLEKKIAQPKPLAEDRLPSPLIQSDNELIVALSQQAVPKETSAAKIAIALEKYVHNKISAKNFSTGFASAADVAKSLEGDCTEHAVLLAAMLRARGVPARTAMGLVYFESTAGTGFAYHMWTEAWIDDHWFPLDATLGKGGIGPGHIKVVDSSLSGAGAFAAFLPVSQVIGQVEIKAVQVK